MLRRLAVPLVLAAAWWALYRAIWLTLYYIMRLTGREFGYVGGLPKGGWSFAAGVVVFVAATTVVTFAARRGHGATAAATIVAVSGLMLAPSFEMDSLWWGVTVFVMLAPAIAAIAGLGFAEPPGTRKGAMLAVAALVLLQLVSDRVMYTGVAWEMFSRLPIASLLTANLARPVEIVTVLVVDAVVLTVCAVAIAVGARRVGGTSPLIYPALAMGAVPAAWGTLVIGWVYKSVVGERIAQFVPINTAFAVGTFICIAMPAAALMFMWYREARRQDGSPSLPNKGFNLSPAASEVA